MTETLENLLMDKTKPTERNNPYAEGSRYHEMYETNPYAQSTIKQSFWDRLANTFGFRSSYDIAEAQRLTSMNEYDAQIEQLKGEDEYNTPEAQAARMRAAGQNPDLLGTEGVQGAAEFAQEQTSPDYSGADQAAKAGEFMQGLTQLILTGMSVTKDIAGVMGILEENKTRKLQNAGKLEELADKFFTIYPQEKNNNKTKDEQTWVGQIIGYIDLFAENNHLNKRQKTQFENAVLARLGSQMGVVFERDKNNLIARKEYGIVKGNKYTPESNEENKILQITGDLANTAAKTEFNEAKHKEYKSKNDKDFEAKRDGTLEGEAFNEENRKKKEEATMKADLQQGINDAIARLEPYVKDGNVLAMILQTGLPILYARIMK